MSFSLFLFPFYPLSLLPISSQRTERWCRNTDIQGVRRLRYRIRDERLEVGVGGGETRVTQSLCLATEHIRTHSEKYICAIQLDFSLDAVFTASLLY